MIEPDETWFDPDIAGMELDYGEKAGLQIFRNYTSSFERHAVEKFVEAINLETLDLTDLLRLVNLIVVEEARFLPVIVCAFADDLLKATFQSALPEGIPGGKSSLFSAYGPLSDLAKRIQLAYAFDLLSPDLVAELDRVRRARNAISHSWKIDDLSNFFVRSPVDDMYRIEELLSANDRFAEEFCTGLQPLAAFRIRLVWIVGRLVYEGAAYNRAKAARLRPKQALYGKPVTKWLEEISKVSLDATRRIAKAKPDQRCSSTFS